MKTHKAFYIDDGVSVPGVLVKRFLRKPMFVASDTRCGWQKQIITKKETKNVVELYGAPSSGKIRYGINIKEWDAKLETVSQIAEHLADKGVTVQPIRIRIGDEIIVEDAGGNIKGIVTHWGTRDGISYGVEIDTSLRKEREE